MKKLMFAIAAVFSLVAVAVEPTVSNVKMQQRYPWNALVDIDYEISGDVEGLSVAFTVNDYENNQTYKPTKFLSSPTVAVGKNRATWDPKAEGVSIVSTNITVTVSLLKAVSPVAPDDKLYMVIDLSGGTTATAYPVSYLSAVPDGGWTDEYKTTKLVLRRIEAGSFLKGNNAVNTTITRPFYIGVFEVTQKQYELVMGNNPSQYKGEMRPAERVTYSAMRGATLGDNWPASSDVDADSFLGRLRSKTDGKLFDLPTEAQWEYACRAGTNSAYNNGGNTENDMKEVGRYSGNTNDGKGGYAQHTVVGLYKSNAWGLYDMHGNVLEWCLNRYLNEEYKISTSFGGEDPKGPEEGVGRISRGGSWYDSAAWSDAEYIMVNSASYVWCSLGTRICCAAGE